MHGMNNIKFETAISRIYQMLTCFVAILITAKYLAGEGVK
jgi:hypothetical protein